MQVIKASSGVFLLWDPVFMKLVISYYKNFICTFFLDEAHYAEELFRNIVAQVEGGN